MFLYNLQEDHSLGVSSIKFLDSEEALVIVEEKFPDGSLFDRRTIFLCKKCASGPNERVAFLAEYKYLEMKSDEIFNDHFTPESLSMKEIKVNNLCDHLNSGKIDYRWMSQNRIYNDDGTYYLRMTSIQNFYEDINDLVK